MININPDILKEGSYDENFEELPGMFMVDIAITESKESEDDILSGESDMDLVDIVGVGDDDEDKQEED